jgi:hypothetical protein
MLFWRIQKVRSKQSAFYKRWALMMVLDKLSIALYLLRMITCNSEVCSIERKAIAGVRLVLP